MATETYFPAENRAHDSELDQLHKTRDANDQLVPLSSLSETDNGPEIHHSRVFDPKKQIWSLFRAQGTRMIVTGVLIALVVVTLKLFSDYGNVDLISKRWFNLIITILSLILGFNFFVRLASLLDIHGLI